jgi:hypothetical protein
VAPATQVELVVRCERPSENADEATYEINNKVGDGS